MKGWIIHILTNVDKEGRCGVYFSELSKSSMGKALGPRSRDPNFDA